MNDYRSKRPRIDILEELRQQGRFYEFFFIAWGIVEMRADECILKAYGLSSQDPKSDPLLELNVDRKLKILRDLDVLPADAYEVVNQFKKKRNHLVHRGALFIHGLSEPEKEEIMDIGMHAADAMHELARTSVR
jgi:hypothetical protein